jgi:uncharacterized GH25 family protein
MRKIVFVSLLVILAVVLTACGGSAPMQESTASKAVNIVVASNPSPAMVGDVELLLTVTDKAGNPIEGAAVNVAADHTDMSGMGMSGLATDQGGGKYSIKANFDESGNWMLTMKVTKDSLDYKEDIEFKVQ